MHTNEFWRLMESTSALSHGNTKMQARLLVANLAVLGRDEVIAFEEILDRFVEQADSRCNSPTSAFRHAVGFNHMGLEYFLLAIIAAGEEKYYSVLGASDPHKIERIEKALGEAEEIAWVPRYAYFRATGQPHPNFDECDYDEGDEYFVDVHGPRADASTPAGLISDVVAA